MARSGPNTRWPDPRRLADQIRLILEALPDVGIDPPNWRPSSREFPKYLFQEGVILVRDEDLDRVRALVPGETRDGLVRGVTLYAPSRQSTLDALNLIGIAGDRCGDSRSRAQRLPAEPVPCNRAGGNR